MTHVSRAPLRPQGYLKEIECQETETGASYELTSDVGVTCNIKNGLACSNKAQPNGRCHNYRIRYYCSCGGEHWACFHGRNYTETTEKYVNSRRTIILILLQFIIEYFRSNWIILKCMRFQIKSSLFSVDPSITTTTPTPEETTTPTGMSILCVH